MKLKNRKTGKIIELQVHHIAGKCYESLADVNKDWEDVEEPKDFWYIDDFAAMCGTEGEFTTPDLATFTKKDIEKLKSIGNYFSSGAEADQAVEKLKAFKRLKDKGFRFNRWTIPEEPKTPHIKLTIEAEMDAPDSPYDLDLLFRTEDEE